MRTEDKELLIKDLSARLPHKTYVKTTKGIGYVYAINTSQLIELSVANNSEYWSEVFNIGEIKPYLRSISSMTDDEMDRLFDILQIDKDGKDEDWIKINDVYGIKFFFPTGKWIEDVAEAYVYLYSIHIDFRGLIRKGLAIEAPEGMYDIIK